MSGSEMVVLQEIGEPKAAIDEFELPCGFLDKEGVLHTTVKLFEITGVEEDLLAAKSSSAHRKMNDVLGNCTLRIGTYTEKSQIREIISELPVGDRVFLMFALRRVTLGDKFRFSTQCPNPRCGEENKNLEVDLSTLDHKKMKDPMKRIFDVVLPSGKKARWKIMRGKDEERVGSPKNEQTSLSIAILLRLELLEDKQPTMDDVRKLGMRDRNFLRTQFNENEGGIDTTVEVDCPACGKMYKVEVDVSQPGFFFPART